MVNSASGRLRELDAFRGIAAIAVMLFHFTTRYDDLYGHMPGVPVFVGPGSSLLLFTITGFAIALTLEKRPGVPQFVVARMSRLFPAYWAAVILTYEIVAWFGLPGRQVGVGQALANLTMFQRFIGVADIDGAYWTLALQINFYIVVCVLIKLRERLSIFRFAAAWLIALFSLRAIEALGFHVPIVLQAVAMTGYGHLFLAGMMFYAIRANPRSRVKGLSLIGGCLFYGFLFQGPADLRLTALFFASMYLLAMNRLRWLAARPLDWMGAISYTLYLVHQNIGFVVMRFAYQHGVTSPTVAIAAAIVVSVTLATLITVCVEQPILHLIRTTHSPARPSSALDVAVPQVGVSGA